MHVYIHIVTKRTVFHQIELNLQGVHFEWIQYLDLYINKSLCVKHTLYNNTIMNKNLTFYLVRNF